MTVPVIANGGIYSAEDALVMLEKTDCDGLAVGQGALGNPFIFREISDALSGRQVIKPEPDEIISLACEHVGMICADKGEYTGVKEIRRQLGALYQRHERRGRGAEQNKLRTDKGRAVLHSDLSSERSAFRK